MMKKLTWPVIGLVVMALLTAVQDALLDQHISAQDWVMVVIQGTMVAHVYLTANLPQYEKMKSWAAGVIAVLQTLYVLIASGLDTSDLIRLGITFLAAVGVTYTRQPVTTVIEGRTITPDGVRAPGV